MTLFLPLIALGLLLYLLHQLVLSQLQFNSSIASARIQRILLSISLMTAFALDALCNQAPWSLLFGLCTFLIAIASNLKIRIHPKSKLVVTVPVSRRLKVKQGQIHLASTVQAFDKETYTELFRIIELAKQNGFDLLTMTSPLLQKSGSIRDTTQFTRILHRYGVTVLIQQSKPCNHMLGIAHLAILKYVLRTESISSLNITQWPTFFIHLHPDNCKSAPIRQKEGISLEETQRSR